MSDIIFEHNLSEKFISVGPVTIYWYSLMFLFAFWFGYMILKRIYIRENKDVKLLDPFLVHMVLGTIIGARLGEVFFYNWEYFQTSIILYNVKYNYDSVLWIFDRLVIAVALGGTLVRIGNFFNSEIVGVFTNSDYGVIFQNRGEILPRHPAQLYEAFGYIILFITLVLIYNKTKLKDFKGFLFGFFLMFLFVVRFIVEYVKESQGGLEEQLGVFSTGQWLSIPFILIGIGLMIYSYISIEKK